MKNDYHLPFGNAALNRRRLLALTGLGAAGALIRPPGHRAFAAETEEAAESPHLTGDIIEGAEDAPVTVIEYASMTCPHCANFHINTWPDLKERYVDTGKVKFIFRDFPFDGSALRASMLARCGGKDRHGAFIDVLFQQQNDWGTAKTISELDERLGRVAKFGGIGEEAYQACMADKVLQTSIIEARLKGQNEFKIQSTPSFIINGKLHSGSMTIEAMAALIDPLLPNQ